MKLSILIPVYNEKSTLSDDVSRVIPQDVDGVDSKGSYNFNTIILEV